MVSMFVDIRQAAELLAFHTGHDSIKMANEISLAGQFHGLKFRLRTNQTIDWSPGFFTVSELPSGKRYVKPVGGQQSPMVKVSIADIVKNPFFRFDEEIQNQILEAHKAAALAKQEQAAALPKQVIPVQRQRAQEQTILDVIAGLKLDPLKLPANDAGKRGVKAKVREALRASPLFTGSKVFDKAWERLTSQQDIKIQEQVSP